MKLSKLLSAVVLMAGAVAAQAATYQFTFNAPQTDAFSFYVESETDSILNLSVITPAFAPADITYTSSLSFINFEGNAGGDEFLVEVELADGGKAKFGAINTMTGAALPFQSPVPEPETYALALAGLGVAVAAARRRRAA